MRQLLLTLAFAFPFVLVGQDNSEGTQQRWFDNWTVRPILAFQGWGTYTIGHEDYDAATDSYLETDNRLNFMLRRLRFGTTAKVGDRLFIKFLGAADFIGADQRSGPVGGVNNGGFPNAQIWDIFAQYKISKSSEVLYVIGGFLRPPIGRESMSGALGVSSFEKSWTQWYVRQHLVGVGPGGAGGVYLGGLVPVTEKVHLDYRGGVFNPQNNQISAGRRASSLYVGRFNFMFGDPEKTTWTYGLPAANSFGKRNTFAVALNVASEGPTGAAGGGIGLLGVDAVANYGMFHVEGEYHRLMRSTADDQDYDSATYAIRAGYNFVIPSDDPNRPRYLEPSAMVYGFDGTTDGGEYATVVATNFFGGTETVYDVGINYHINPGRVRLGLHYVGRTGDIGDLPADGRLSWHNMQGGIGGIQRGDYVGFEVILAY